MVILAYVKENKDFSRKRLILGLISVVFLTQFARTMAADLIPADPLPVAAPSDSSSPVASDPPPQLPAPVASDPASQVSPAPLATDAPLVPAVSSSTPSAKPSPTPTPPHALASQSLVVQIPNVISVDPRARSVLLPQIAVYGSTNILACISSAQILFAAGFPNTTANAPAGSPLVSGNMSTNLLVSGTAGQVMAILNLSDGMRVTSTGPAIANRSATFSFVAVSEPTINPALCGSGSVSNSRTLTFQAMGLDLSMAKGTVRLKV